VIQPTPNKPTTEEENEDTTQAEDVHMKDTESGVIRLNKEREKAPDSTSTLDNPDEIITFMRRRPSRNVNDDSVEMEEARMSRKTYEHCQNVWEKFKKRLNQKLALKNRGRTIPI
jgi:hypothetical protein